MTVPTKGPTHIEYEIDPLQRRLGQKVNGVGSSRVRYIYSPEGKVVGQLDANNKLVKTYAYGSKEHVPDYYVDSSNNKFRIITDHLGSVRLIVNASTGVGLQVMKHDEFGVVLQDTNPGLTPFGFAGGVYSYQSGLVRFGMRDYDAETGRWTNKDPIRFDGRDTNLYGYVFNDPVNLIDNDGFAARRADDMAGVAGIGGGGSNSGSITGYTRHGLNQAIGREGKGVNPRAILDAVKNPKTIKLFSEGVIRYQGQDATVILNGSGKVITTFPSNSSGLRCGE